MRVNTEFWRRRRFPNRLDCLAKVQSLTSFDSFLHLVHGPGYADNHQQRAKWILCQTTFPIILSRQPVERAIGYQSRFCTLVLSLF
jgi:hypothetical protein